jgi:hypothetical protein
MNNAQAVLSVTHNVAQHIVSETSEKKLSVSYLTPQEYILLALTSLHLDFREDIILSSFPSSLGQ